jgi:hypothetical protein
MASKTAQIMNEFVSNIDDSKSYSVDEINKVLASAYNKIAKNSKNSKNSKKPTTTENTDTNTEETKKKPSEYNKFMKIKMSEIKVERPELDAKERMKLAAAEWSKQKQQAAAE